MALVAAPVPPAVQLTAVTVILLPVVVKRAVPVEETYVAGTEAPSAVTATEAQVPTFTIKVIFL